jgi:hypothetical protein
LKREGAAWRDHPASCPDIISMHRDFNILLGLLLALPSAVSFAHGESDFLAGKFLPASRRRARAVGWSAPR